MVEGTPKPDGYIAVRRAELAQGIAAADGLPEGEVGAFGDVLKLLDALLQYEAHERLEALKTLYDPLDPDAPPTRRDLTPAALDAFEQALVEALTRANFVEVDHDTVQTREATKLLTGLSIKPSLAGIRRIRFFARGARPGTTSLLEALIAVNVASGCPDGFATYSSCPPDPSRIITNSNSFVAPSPTVRDIPISVPPSGALHCSMTCRPFRVRSQHPLSHPRSAAVVRAWVIGTSTSSRAMIMCTIYGLV